MMPRNSIIRIGLCLCAIGLQSAWVQAQPPGGRGGGRGGFGGFGGMMDLMYDEDVTRSLDITDDQLEEVGEIREEAQAKIEELDFGSQFRDAESDEDRAAIMDEMRLAGEANNAEAEEKLKSLLDEGQYSRLRQIYLQRSGVQSLGRGDVITSLGISVDQQTEIRAILQERGAARMELGFRASPEDQAAFDQEWDSRLLAVLTEEQRDQWTAELGEPFVPGEDEEAVAADEDEVNETDEDEDDETPIAAAPGTAQTNPGMRPARVREATNSFGEGAAGPEPMLTFSFNDAPWELVLRRLADISGFSLDLAEEPPGSFTYFDPEEYTPTEARDIINGYLAMRGYGLIRNRNALVSVKLDEIPPNLIPRITLDQLADYGQNDMVSVVIPAAGVDVAELSEQLESLSGPQGKIAALEATNTIVVTDLGVVVRQAAEAVSQISGGPEDIVFQAIKLEHISAAQAEPTVKTLLGISSSVVSVAQGQPNPWGGGGGGWGGRGRGDDDDDNQGWQMPQPAAKPQVTIDTRTNSLLVAGTPSQVRIVENALKIIDVEAEAGQWGTGPGEPYLVVYTVTEANAGEVGRTVNTMLPGTVVNEDERNGFIHVHATAEQHQEISTLIRQMDGQGGASTVVVIPLSRMDPLTAVNMLTSMFIGDGANAPTIEADGFGRQVMIRGTQEQIAQARTILVSMGEDGSGKRVTGGTLQSFPLSGRDPAELLQLVEAMWGRQNTTPVTIISPEERRQQDRVEFFGRPDSQISEPSRTRPPYDDASLPSEYLLEDLVPEETPPAPSTPAAAVPTRTSAPRVQVHPLRDADDDLLVLTSLNDNGCDDPAAETPSDEAAAPVAAEQTEAVEEPVVTEPAATEAAVEEPAAQAEETEPETTTEPATTEPEPVIETEPVAQTDETAEVEQDSSGVDLSEVRITVVGGEIIVEHPDPQVVDEMMALLETVIQTVPPRSNWKIFPLQVADATTVATLLATVIPEATVVRNTTTSSSGLLGGLTSGIGNLSSNVMSMTGLDSTGSMGLQIIPETTHNALLVTGPQYLIDEVVVWLNILDSNEWPDNMRNREPKMIAVRYADALDVYNILQQTYSDLLDNEQSRQGRQAQQALAAMFGGGGGRGGGGQQEQQPPAMMTLSYDPRTNHIIVSANEELFLEVQGIVEDLDNAAREARRTVQVVHLQYSNPQVVSRTVGSLMPRVSVSGSGTGTTRTSTSNSNGSGNGNSGPNPDDFRRMMEFRNQLQGGQGGGGQGGRGFGGGGQGGFQGGGFGGGGRGGFGGGGFSQGGRGFGGGGFGGGGGQGGGGGRGDGGGGRGN
jgi:type II secretory pathway component GspD/PulD (secretin)